jgi:fatty acid desaturase
MDRPATSETEASPRLPEDLRSRLETLSPARHLAIALGVFALLALGLVASQSVALPLAIGGSLVTGACLFLTTILLHEQTHGLIFRRHRPGLERLLGLCYATPAGLSASQFGRWHGDHHAHLGELGQDPKRTHLSPQRNARWVKLVFFTPLLFPRYFAAARTAAAGYPPALRRRIAGERLLALVVHGGWVTGLALLNGWSGVVLGYLIPLWLVFPVVFALNRLGQHYHIDHRHPDKCGSRVDGNPLWQLLFLWSNFHLEHHYYPRVPFYRLPALNRALRPYFQRIGWPSRGYAWLLWQWLGRNRQPHSLWQDASDKPEAAPA